MGVFTSLVSLFVIVLLTVLVNRVATAALTFTGMSREMAKFQARSAFTTAGFTTTESENVVNHPVRRRIIMLLMMAGNIGFAGIVVAVLGSFSGEQDELSFAGRLGILAAGLALLWIIALSKWLDDKLFLVIKWALKKFTHLEAHDFLDLLHLGKGFTVTELSVEPEDWLVGHCLEELQLSRIGVNVLGIHRTDGEYVGSPVGNTYVRRGDRLIVYGSREHIIHLDECSADPAEGEKQLKKAPAEQRQRERAGDERTPGAGVVEVLIAPSDWLVGKRLDRLRLADLGVNVLGIHRADGSYVGSPVGSTRIEPGDRLIAYASTQSVEALESIKGDADKEAEHLGFVDERRRHQYDERHAPIPADEGTDKE